MAAATAVKAAKRMLANERKRMVKAKAAARPKITAGVGVIRKAIVSEMTRRNWTRRDVVNASKVPTTPVFEFLRDGENDRGISLRHAERIMHVMGIGITMPKPADYPAKKQQAADDGE